MKIANMSKTTLFCVSLLGLSIPCLANEIPDSVSNSQVIQQAEAVVLHIDQNNVTLQDLGDKNNKIIDTFSNAGEFKAGDKVIFVGNTLKKASSDTNTTPTDNKL